MSSNAADNASAFDNAPAASMGDAAALTVASASNVAATNASNRSAKAAGMGVMHTTEAPQIIEHLNKSINFTPMDVRWIPVSARFVAVGTYARGTGAIVVHEMTPSEVKVVKEIERPTGVKCATFGASFLEDRHIAVGDFGGNATILDLEKPGTPVWSVKVGRLPPTLAVGMR